MPPDELYRKAIAACEKERYITCLDMLTVLREAFPDVIEVCCGGDCIDDVVVLSLLRLSTLFMQVRKISQCLFISYYDAALQNQTSMYSICCTKPPQSTLIIAYRGTSTPPSP